MLSVASIIRIEFVKQGLLLDHRAVFRFPHTRGGSEKKEKIHIRVT
jgi:hypothetical protein